MRVVQGEDPDVCVRAIAGIMFNIENGSKVVQDNGSTLNRLLVPKPGYVSIPVRASVQNSPPLDFWCRPRVGLVFYTASSGLDVGKLVARIKDLITGLGHDHLVQKFNPVEAAPSGILYHGAKEEMITPTTVAVGPRRPYQRAGTFPTVPARMLLWTSSTNEDVPSPISYRAAFTWVFMNVSAIMDVTVGPAIFNALTASVLYDADRVTQFKTGLITFEFSSKNLAFEPLTPAAKSIETFIATSRRGKHVRRFGFVLDVAKRSLYVLHGVAESYAIYPAGQQRTDLPIDPHALGTRSRCFMCSAAVWGEFYTLKNFRFPSPASIDGWFDWMGGLKTGDRLVPEEIDDHMVVCRFCFGAFPKCFGRHFPLTAVHRHVAPICQADSLRSDKADPLATLVEMVEDGIQRLGKGIFLIGKNLDIVLVNGRQHDPKVIIKNLELVKRRKWPLRVEFWEMDNA